MNTVVSMIFALCVNDKALYLIQDEQRDCHEYYANCVIDKGGDENAVLECKEKADEKRVK
jgi:hypothetical protein